MYTDIELYNARVSFTEAYPDSVITSMHYNIINPRYIWATHIHDALVYGYDPSAAVAKVAEIDPIITDNMLTDRGVRSIELTELIRRVENGNIGELCRLGFAESGIMIPPFLTSPSVSGSTSTRSPNGLIFMDMFLLC